MMGKLGFYFNLQNCIGCKTCQIACRDKNNTSVGVWFRQLKNFETGAYPHPGLYHYSSTCNHCETPKCTEGCPTRAMHIAEDGTVQHDDDKCIGCRFCVWNCPYGVPQFIEATGKIGKCDSCKDLREKGSNPVCVDACVMRCLEFGDLDELRQKHAGENLVQEIAVLPAASLTKPSLLINPKAAALDTNYKEKEV